MQALEVVEVLHLARLDDEFAGQRITLDALDDGGQRITPGGVHLHARLAVALADLVQREPAREPVSIP